MKKIVYIGESLFINYGIMASYPTLFDRLNTTFEYLFSKATVLILVNLCFNVFFIVGFKSVAMFYLLNLASFITPQFGLYDMLYVPAFLYVIFFGIIFFIVFSFAAILMTLWNIITFQQIFSQQEVTVFANFVLARKKYFSLFKTYWFMFYYIFFMPAILFIIGGGIYLANDYYNLSLPMGEVVGIVCMGVAFFWALINSIYKTYRSVFATFHAITQSEFTSKNFKESLEFTQGKYWRIIGNFLFLGIIFQVAFQVLNFVTGTIYPSYLSSMDFQEDMSLYSITQDVLTHFSWTSQIAVDILATILTTIIGIIALIFTFLFYKDLQKEYNDSQAQSTDIVV